MVKSREMDRSEPLVAKSEGVANGALVLPRANRSDRTKKNPLQPREAAQNSRAGGEILTADHATLARFPEAFEAVAGISVAEFDTLVEEIAPAHEAAELIRKFRTDRRNKIGAGAPPRLSLQDRVLVSLIGVRFGARKELEWMFDVGRSTIPRAIGRLKPILLNSSAARLLVPLSVPERQERLLLATQHLPHRGGFLRLLGGCCGIWIELDGRVEPRPYRLKNTYCYGARGGAPD